MPRMQRTAKRAEGACTACHQAKTKCDQKQPQCSRCSHRGIACMLRTFRPVNFTSPHTAHPRRRHQQRRRGTQWVVSNPGGSTRKRGRKVTEGLPPQEPPQAEAPPRGETTQLTPRGELLWSDEVVPVPESIQGHGHQRVYGPSHSPSVHPSQVHSTTTLPAETSAITTNFVDQVQIQFLWHHFVHHTAKDFLIWDTQAFPRDQKVWDPYAVGLPAMATSSLPLFYASLALSAFHYIRSNQDESMLGLQSRLEHMAIEALASPSSVGPQSVQQHLHTVTCIMLLCLSSPKEYTDLLPLARSAAACLVSDRSRAGLDPDQFSVAMMLIRWCEICVLCSPRSNTKLSEESIHRLIECTVDEDEFDGSAAFKDWVIHPLYGFSRRLVKPLLKVTRLARCRQNTADSVTSESTLEAEINGIEMELLRARDLDLASISARHQDEQNLLHLNEAIYSVAVLIFYTRLRDLMWTTALVRKHVGIVCAELAQVDSQSRTSLALLFPYFVAGCEAVDSAVRTDILRQLNHLPKNWLNRASTTARCLQHVWALRDEDPAAPWVCWTNKVSVEFAACIPI